MGKQSKMQNKNMPLQKDPNHATTSDQDQPTRPWSALSAFHLVLIMKMFPENDKCLIYS
jgi:hypothetical protein